METATINFTEAAKSLVSGKLEKIARNTPQCFTPIVPYDLMKNALHLHIGKIDLFPGRNRTGDERVSGRYAHFMLVGRRYFCCGTDFPIDRYGDRVE